MVDLVACPCCHGLGVCPVCHGSRTVKPAYRVELVRLDRMLREVEQRMFTDKDADDEH